VACQWRLTRTRPRRQRHQVGAKLGQAHRVTQPDPGAVATRSSVGFGIARPLTVGRGGEVDLRHVDTMPRVLPSSQRHQPLPSWRSTQRPHPTTRADARRLATACKPFAALANAGGGSVRGHQPPALKQTAAERRPSRPTTTGHTDRRCPRPGRIVLGGGPRATNSLHACCDAAVWAPPAVRPMLARRVVDYTPHCAPGVRPDLPHTSAPRDGMQAVRCSRECWGGSVRGHQPPALKQTAG
jgi:hypothetical protein